MRPQRLLITATLFAFVGCGGGGDRGAPEAAKVSTTDPTSASEQTVEQQTPQVVEPSSLIVDVETQRIFVPSEGWITADAFWDLYYTHPERLPGDIDFDAVNQLGPMPPAPGAEP